MLRLGTVYVMCSSNDQMKSEAELNAQMLSILSKAFGTMQIHYGSARLGLSITDRLEGEYYSGCGRQNFGALRLNNHAQA